MRTELKIELYCSKHPEQELELEIDKSKISAHSACDLASKISVEPCKKCQHEFDLLKWAINEVMAVKNEEAINIINDNK